MEPALLRLQRAAVRLRRDQGALCVHVLEGRGVRGVCLVFADAFTDLAQLWEALSPDPGLAQFADDYRWLAQVYDSLRPPSGNGKLLWHALGAKTIELIGRHVDVREIRDDLDSLVLDADLIEDMLSDPDRHIPSVEAELTKRLRRRAGDPQYKALSERLEQLRLKHEQGLLASVEFLKSLLDLGRDVVAAERSEPVTPREDRAKAVLTELFESVRNDETPVIVERIVTDIDQIVRVVRFDGWQRTEAGEREVKKALRSTLLKYKLHKDHDLFDRAYEYVRQYY